MNSLFSWRLCEASLEAKRKSEANTGRPLIQARKESRPTVLVELGFWHHLIPVFLAYCLLSALASLAALTLLPACLAILYLSAQKRNE